MCDDGAVCFTCHRLKALTTLETLPLLLRALGRGHEGKGSAEGCHESRAGARGVQAFVACMYLSGILRRAANCGGLLFVSSLCKSRFLPLPRMHEQQRPRQ